MQRDLLTEEPYRSYGIDLETFFARGSPRMHEDLISLSDRVWGWDSDYEVLGRAAREAVRDAPGDIRAQRARDFVGGALTAALRRACRGRFGTPRRHHLRAHRPRRGSGLPDADRG